MNKSISIIGCGWLGTPLAIKLIEEGYSVKGSTTSNNKTDELKNIGVEPFIIKLNGSSIEGDYQNFLNSNILIVNIPPSKGMDSPDDYNLFVNEISKSTIQHLIFISTTSAYKELTGTVSEEDAHPENKFVQIENKFRDALNFKTTIIRFGGLISEDRNPVKYFAGRKNISDGNDPVNLIHRDDCVKVISEILRQNIWDETFNCVSDDHPTKSEYYTEIAKRINLETPHFNEDKSDKYKIVSNTKVKKMLKINFKGLLS